MPPPTFTITDSFVLRGRGTVLVGPPESEARALLKEGDDLELLLPDGQTIRTKLAHIGHFAMTPQPPDPPAGLLLTTDIGKVPPGTSLRRAPSTVADIKGPWADPNFGSSLIDRCRSGWHTPVAELTNLLLATYLRQKIALSLLLPEANKRLAAGYTDDTEMYDEELADAVEFATRKT